MNRGALAMGEVSPALAGLFKTFSGFVQGIRLRRSIGNRLLPLELTPSPRSRAGRKLNMHSLPPSHPPERLLPLTQTGDAGPTGILRLRVPPLVVTATAVVVGWLSARTFPALGLESASNLRGSAAGALVVLGSVCSLLGVASFRRARTTVNPMQPEAATALVVCGLYRVTRNPMYLGFLFLLLGALAWLAHPIALLVAPAFVIYLNRFQIVPEEQALHDRFGREYSNYAARVRRWI